MTGARENSFFRGPARVVLSAGTVACLVGALSLVSATSASAVPLPANHYGGPGAPAWRAGSGGRYFGHGYGPVVGTVVTAPASSAPTTFTMNVAGTAGTTTLVTVDVSTTTTLAQPGFSSPALAYILAGDQVEVSGTQAGTNTLGATSVRLPELRQSGTVVTAPASSVPTTFTMDLAGTGSTTTIVTVDVSTTTTLSEPGFSSPVLVNIVAGDQVSVAGTQAGYNTLGAISVTLPAVRESGTVVTAPGATAPTTFTMNVAGTGSTSNHGSWNGSWVLTATASTLVTVDVSPTTALSEPGTSSPSLGTILAGDQMSVTGTQGGTNTLGATSLTLPSVRESGSVVTAPGATAPTTFTMDVAGTGGTTTLVTVDVSTTTTLNEPGTSSPSLGTILAGDQVQVLGTQGGTNTVGATSVTVVPVSSGYGSYGGHGRGGHGRR